MNISQTNNVLTLTSTPANGYYFVQYVTRVDVVGETVLHAPIVVSSSEYTLSEDSYFKLAEIKIQVLPVTIPQTIPGTGYYSDGASLYGEGEEITEEQLWAVDPSGTNLTRVDYDLISTYNLDTYYLNLLKNKYLSNMCNCSCINKSDKMLIDTLTMGLELIGLLTTRSQYYEADRIINQLSYCANLTTDQSCNCNG